MNANSEVWFRGRKNSDSDNRFVQKKGIIYTLVQGGKGLNGALLSPQKT